MAKKKYICSVCGQTFEADSMPSKCPICNADASAITEVGAKKKIDTNSNLYTILYASVVVIIVAFLLAFVSKVLEPQSQANERIDKKKQILASLNIRGLAAQDVEAKYMEVVLSDDVIDIEAQTVQAGAEKDKAGFAVPLKQISDRQLPVYVCQIDGEQKYVFPMVGKGLWGGIWGYLAMNADMRTVYGCYFSHESETAGLGARITEEAFQNEFIGKNITNQDDSQIALSVVKNGKVTDAGTQCDGITGATLTSVGVNDMIQQSLAKYSKYLKLGENN